MRYVIFLFLMFSQFALLGQNGMLAKNVEIKLEKELKEVFTDQYSTKLTVKIAPEQLNELSFHHQDDVIFQLKDIKNQIIGFAYVGKTTSKVAYFDYVVIFDKNLVISKVKVLIYREDHGGEITHKRWLAQFKGLEKNQNILYKKDIAGISGATISASSLTNAVNNVLKSISNLHQLKLL